MTAEIAHRLEASFQPDQEVSAFAQRAVEALATEMNKSNNAKGHVLALGRVGSEALSFLVEYYQNDLEEQDLEWFQQALLLFEKMIARYISEPDLGEYGAAMAAEIRADRARLKREAAHAIEILPRPERTAAKRAAAAKSAPTKSPKAKRSK